MGKTDSMPWERDALEDMYCAEVVVGRATKESHSIGIVLNEIRQRSGEITDFLCNSIRATEALRRSCTLTNNNSQSAKDRTTFKSEQLTGSEDGKTQGHTKTDMTPVAC